MGSPMPTILLRTESASSSQIEQLTTSPLQLALAAIEESPKSNAAAVLGNVHAMEHGIAVPGKLSVESIRLMHRPLRADDRMMSGDAGPIIAQFASAARFASRSARNLMDQLSAVLGEMERRLEG